MIIRGKEFQYISLTQYPNLLNEDRCFEIYLFLLPSFYYNFEFYFVIYLK